MHRLDELRRLADEFLAGLPFAAELGRLEEALRYSLLGGGKRIRPVLCLATGEALERPPEELLPAACSLELVHTFSLVHDDLPALDDDDLRRGVPTCHVVFGEATAILAGDSLLTHGLGMFAQYPRGDSYAAAKVRVLQTVVDAIGTHGMIGGQAADLEAEKETDPTAELVGKIHENKTGRLIRASLLSGAILAGAGEDALARVDHYGRRIGLAFQIKDDLLDVESDAATLGKAAGKDSAHGKATFPGVWGVERSRELLAENVNEAVVIASSLPGGGGVLPELARFVGSRKS
ncbi:MAG TPA: farnesyl diphosphate synthase [Thermoanaerobaculia bacterium]